MKKEKLEIIRDYYDKLNRENQRKKDAEKEYKDLIKDPKVIRYIELRNKNRWSNNILDDDELITKPFSDNINFSEEGPYIYNISSSFTHQYYNLMTGNYIEYVNEDAKKEFELSHIILDLPEDLEYGERFIYIKKLRLWYLKELLNRENEYEDVLRRVRVLEPEEFFEDS